MGTKCFLLEPIREVRRSLRRYSSSEQNKCLGGHGYHNAQQAIDNLPAIYRIEDNRVYLANRFDVSDFKGDTRWPTACAACGYAFTDDDCWQVFIEEIYKRSDNGALTTLRDAPVGAMWFADWMGKCWRGPDGRSLMVRLPYGHDWCVDSRASNCGKPNDNEHKCWVRHGTAPNITVDKNGLTCSAGAGSIDTGKWHGFLRNGELTP